MIVFRKIIEWVEEKLKIIGAACLVGMALLTCADVTGRFFRHPILGSMEIVGFMAIITVAMALPYTHRIGGHVGVEILVRRFSERTQTIIDIITRALSIFLFAIVTWQMALYALSMQRSGEVSMNLELPVYVIIYITSFCLLILTLAILQETFGHIKKLKSLKKQ
ncbi:MAG: TRAP transporter small permease [Deltaproteobacteria bacterium]|nr:TRAP transporter small permease [Deltaproteobacteria bacterium]